MTAQMHSDPSDDAIAEAAEWMFRVDQAPGDTALQAELAAWRIAGPDHEAAWLIAVRAWSLSGELGPVLVDRWIAPAQPVPPARRTRSRRWMRMAGASRSGRRDLAAGGIVAALALLLSLPSLSLLLRADHRTASGATEDIVLADGSRVALGGDSALAEHFSDRGRAVALLRGEAFFDVAHDGRRPFTVAADDITVTVTGTAFDVSMTPASLIVAVERGSVTVEREAGDPVAVALAPGDWLSIDRRSGAHAVSKVSLAEVGTWRQGRLAVRAARLGDEVDAIDRQYSGMIVMRGEIDARRVTGVYDLADPDRALRMLARSHGLRIRRMTPWVTLLSPE